jgi:hypothetical protein
VWSLWYVRRQLRDTWRRQLRDTWRGDHGETHWAHGRQFTVQSRQGRPGQVEQTWRSQCTTTRGSTLFAPGGASSDTQLATTARHRLKRTTASAAHSVQQPSIVVCTFVHLPVAYFSPFVNLHRLSCSTDKSRKGMNWLLAAASRFTCDGHGFTCTPGREQWS